MIAGFTAVQDEGLDCLNVSFCSLRLSQSCGYTVIYCCNPLVFPADEPFSCETLSVNMMFWVLLWVPDGSTSVMYEYLVAVGVCNLVQLCACVPFLAYCCSIIDKIFDRQANKSSSPLLTWKMHGSTPETEIIWMFQKLWHFVTEPSAAALAFNICCEWW